MTRMRARIAERLMQSKNSIAMLTSFNEVNLGKVMAMRKELGEAFEKANGIKLGFMSFFAKAAANALLKGRQNLVRLRFLDPALAVWGLDDLAILLRPPGRPDHDHQAGDRDRGERQHEDATEA